MFSGFSGFLPHVIRLFRLFSAPEAFMLPAFGRVGGWGGMMIYIVGFIICSRSGFQGKRRKTFKWEVCPGHAQRSFQPHLLKSGQKRGSLILCCSAWWCLGDTGRGCWERKAFPMHRFSELPQWLKDEYTSLEMGFARSNQGS